MRKYVFTADQLPDHYSKSALGHSYSVWLPWDEVGGPQRQIGLVARFEGRKGGVVMSDMSRQTLPGIGFDLATQKPANQQDGVKQVAHLANADAAADERGVAEGPSMSTSTIAIPPSFARRALAAIDRAGSQPTAQQRQLEATARLAAAIEESAAAEDASRDNVGEDNAGREAEQPATASSSHDDPAEDSAARSAPSRVAASTSRFARAKFPAPTQPKAPPRPDPVRRRPHPAGWPSGLSPTPRAGQAGVSRATGAVDASAQEPANPPAER